MSVLRSTPFPVVALAYAMLRITVVVGQPAGRFPDTAGWLTLTWWGDNTRFWPVPFIFTLAASDGVRIATQVAIGIVAWVFFAATLARLSRFPRTMGYLTLLIGLTPQVVRWDLAILSESLSISFAVVTMATTLRLITRTGGFLPWIASVCLFGLTRPSHLIVIFACAVVGVIAVVQSRGARLLIPSIVFVAASVWGWALLEGNRATSYLNMYTVLSERIMPHDERYQWFVAEGMPDVAGAREAAGYDLANQLPDDVRRIVGLPLDQQPPSLMRVGGVELATWVRNRGLETYTRYVLTHPDDTINRMLDLADATMQPANDDFLPLESRAVVPRVLFVTWQFAVAIGAVSLVIAAMRAGGGRTALGMTAVALMIVALYGLSILYSGIEHPRHASTVAVAVRVWALGTLALAFPASRDRPLAGRSRSRRGVASEDDRFGDELDG